MECARCSLGRNLRVFASSIDRVKYLDYDVSEFTEANHLSPFFHKRTQFEFEREARIVVWGQLIAANRSNGFQPLTRRSKLRPEFELSDMGVYQSVDIEELVEEIYVSPHSPRWFGRLVEDLGCSYGLNRTVKRSPLYDRPR